MCFRYNSLLGSCHFSNNIKGCFKPLLSLIVFSSFRFFYVLSENLIWSTCPNNQDIASVYILFFFTANPVTILHLNCFLTVVSCIDQKVSVLCSTFVHNRLPTPPPICAAQSLINEETILDSLSLLKIGVLVINTMCFGKVVPNLVYESWSMHCIFLFVICHTSITL